MCHIDEGQKESDESLYTGLVARYGPRTKERGSMRSDVNGWTLEERVQYTRERDASRTFKKDPPQYMDRLEPWHLMKRKRRVLFDETEKRRRTLGRAKVRLVRERAKSLPTLNYKCNGTSFRRFVDEMELTSSCEPTSTHTLEPTGRKGALVPRGRVRTSAIRA